MSLTNSEDYRLNLKVGQLQNLLPLNDHWPTMPEKDNFSKNNEGEVLSR